MQTIDLANPCLSLIPHRLPSILIHSFSQIVAFLSRQKGQAILAGDPLQLGPVVASRLASDLGLGTSFLARLLKRFPYTKDLEGFPETGGYDPRLVTKLVYNYRSVPSILEVFSEMFYDSELVATVSIGYCAAILLTIKGIIPNLRIDLS